MPARGDGVGGVLMTAGFRSRDVCGPKMRARPGGSVSVHLGGAPGARRRSGNAARVARTRGNAGVAN